MSPHLTRCRLPSPIGELTLLADADGLVSLRWGDRTPSALAHLSRHLGTWTTEDVPSIPGVSESLEAYLSGDLNALSHVAVRPPGTPFQRRVWAALRTIPCGQTWSYAQLAGAIGQPTASRAVAGANGANPIPLAIPCHRVISADGHLGGFSAGLHRKEWLLTHEGVVPGPR